MGSPGPESGKMTDSDAVLSANAAYYRAFRTGDDALMGRVWGLDDVTCVHPGWPVIVGRAPVLESYRQIMSNPRQDPVTADDERVFLSGDWARVMCMESVGTLMLATTNLFIRVGTEWRMIHHQASPLAALRTRRASSSLN